MEGNFSNRVRDVISYSREEAIRLTFPFNALGWPVLALPCGSAEHGLPASLSLIASYATFPVASIAFSLLAALSGQPACFIGDDLGDLPPCPRCGVTELRPEVSPALERIVLRALDREPQQRRRTADRELPDPDRLEGESGAETGEKGHSGMFHRGAMGSRPRGRQWRAVRHIISIVGAKQRA